MFFTSANNYLIHIKKIPLTNEILSSKENLINWLILIHNEVNKINKKKNNFI